MLISPTRQQLLCRISSCVGIALLTVSLWNGNALAAQTTDDAAAKTEVNPKTPSPDMAPLLDLVGKTVEITLDNGVTEGPFEVVGVTETKDGDAIKSIRVKVLDGKRKKTFRGKKIAEIYADGQPVDVVYVRDKKGLIFSVKKRDARIKANKAIDDRLKKIGHRKWPELTESQQDKFLTDQRQFLKNVAKEMPQVPFRFVETDFFMAFTDLEPQLVNGYLTNLDAMYRELCAAFGISLQKNIWCGKCVIVIFKNRENYMLYEAQVMGVKDPRLLMGSQGLCHMFGDGQVKFAGYRGDGSFFGHVLIHETTHGFIHRYYSSVNVKSWLNEGIDDWVANAIMQDDSIGKRQKRSAKQIMESGGWGDFLTAGQIEFGHYGAASTLVDILLSRNKDGQFRVFFQSIKQGKPIEQSLQESFGVTFKDLETAYVQWISQ